MMAFEDWMEMKVKVKRGDEYVEICNECGESVAMGSGRFVNRVADLNDVETKKGMGRKYPQGCFVCAECDYKLRDVEEKQMREVADDKRYGMDNCGDY